MRYTQNSKHPGSRESIAASPPFVPVAQSFLLSVPLHSLPPLPRLAPIRIPHLAHARSTYISFSICEFITRNSYTSSCFSRRREPRPCTTTICSSTRYGSLLTLRLHLLLPCLSLPASPRRRRPMLLLSVQPRLLVMLHHPLALGRIMTPLPACSANLVPALPLLWHHRITPSDRRRLALAKFPY